MRPSEPHKIFLRANVVSNRSFVAAARECAQCDHIRQLVDQLSYEFDALGNLLFVRSNESLQQLLKLFAEWKFFVSAELSVRCSAAHSTRTGLHEISATAGILD